MTESLQLTEADATDCYPPGDLAIWIFILAELAVFALFFAAYAFTRMNHVEMFNSYQQQLDRESAFVNTLALITSSYFGVRSVGIPPWVKVALDRWGQASGMYHGRVFRALNKDGSLAGSVRTKGGTRTDGFLTPQAIYNVVKEHVLAAGFYNRKGEAALAAHDLRRTAAALALKGGADLRQIQQMLGHASITTTERYLEPMRSLQVTAGDFIQIELTLTTH